MENNIPIFDSLSHPSERNLWFNNTSINHSFKDLKNEYNKYNFIGGCAVHIPIMSDVSPQDYYDQCVLNGFYPVYYYDFKKDIDQIKYLHSIGYKALKIHVRLGGIDPEKEFSLLKNIFKECELLNITIFFCTLIHGDISIQPNNGLLSIITRLLKSVPNIKIILLHGGDVDLMKFVQLVRFNENVLIDLSFTIQKFEGSSLDLDIAYLFNTFDRRICVGSDYPDYSIEYTRKRFNNFAAKTTVEKAKNIGYKNIQKFLKI